MKSETRMSWTRRHPTLGRRRILGSVWSCRLVATACWTAWAVGCGTNASSGSPDARAYRVTGAIVRGGAPVTGVAVNVDGAANWTVLTDVQGRFDIAGVSAGAHTVGVSTSNDDGSFSERRSSIQVTTADVTLGDLVLPRPLALGPAVSTADQVQIAWEATDAVDFREYKLYRRDSPGIDEVAGELIFVSTARDQTTFLDTGLLAGKKYYYRVYLMNDLGRLGGSNIVSTTIDVANLIPGGAFDDAAVLSGWTIEPGLQGGTVTIDPAAPHGGAGSLHMPNGTGVKLIQPIAIQTDVAYDLDLALKLKGARNNIDDGWIGVYQGDKIVATFPLDVVPAGSVRTEDVDWVAVGPLVFSVTAEGAITLRIISYTDEMWVDDLTLLPHQAPAAP